MTVAELPWALDGRGLQLIRVPSLALHALGGDNATLAMELEPNLLTPYLLGEECQGLWRYRSKQISGNPLDSAWITRIAVDARTSTPVGLAGFHGRPDARGMVEIGYRIDPAFGDWATHELPSRYFSTSRVANPKCTSFERPSARTTSHREI
ncbi:hypothetical protein [Rhodococcus erythropolis]|uniref:hypothetical protein n=1 Tax=Rhodococcus erythropolis TaxID=1833 RepID=UPI0022B3BE9F|nr:hypothetical protein [Rhodococcus erythropolis]MCZ4643196.1 hypothetical protein [Rhodococcus erythropolis]